MVDTSTSGPRGRRGLSFGGWIATLFRWVLWPFRRRRDADADGADSAQHAGRLFEEGRLSSIFRRRLLLIEFVNADQFPGRLSYTYPFVSGWCTGRGVPVRWIRFGIATTNLMEHGRDEFTLSDDEMERLLAVVDEHEPGMIIITDPLWGPQLDLLREHAPGARIQDPTALHMTLPGKPEVGFTDLPEILKHKFLLVRFGMAGDWDDYHHFFDAGATPRLDWEPGNEAARREDIDNYYFWQPQGCGHRKCVADNPVYADFEDDRLYHLGCSFCESGSGYQKAERGTKEGREGATGRPVLRFFIRGLTTNPFKRQKRHPSERARLSEAQRVALQIRGVAESRGTADRYPHGLLLEQLGGPAVVRQCLETMQELGMAGRVQLLLAVRTAEVKRFEAALREHWENVRGAAIRIGVYASGVESFSGNDLLLFNKGTRPIDSLRAVNTFRELADTFPERFWYTGVSLIMFTPWTTPERLHLNVGLLRLLGLSRKVAGNMFQSRMRLHYQLPITFLAEREGLVVEEESDQALSMNRRKLFRSERPWRFADARMRPLSRIVLRYDLLGGDLADDLAREVEQRLRAGNPRWTDGDDMSRLEFLLAMTDVVRSESDVLDEIDILDRGLELWRRRRDEAVEKPPARRFRIGERRVDLEGLVEGVVGVAEQGHKPVLTVENVGADEVSADVKRSVERAGLRCAFVDDGVRGTGATGTLVIVRDEASIAGWTGLAETIAGGAGEDRRAAIIDVGRLHGYPDCCATAFADGSFSDVSLPSWAALSKRAEEPGAAPWENNPLLVPALGFVPCSPDCSAAVAVYRKLFAAVLPSAGEEMSAYLFSVGGPGDGTLIALKPTASDERTLRYDPEAIAPGDEPLRQRLREGDRLRIVPGQVQVASNDDLVELMTATHGVWFAERCWHADEWHELARGVAIRARTAPEIEVPPDQPEEPPPDPGPDPALAEEAERRRERYDFLLGAVIDKYGDRFGDVAVGDLAVDIEHAVVNVSLSVGGDRYDLILSRPEEGERYVFRSKHFGVVHTKETPLSSAEHRQRLADLVKVFDGAVAHYAPELLLS